MPTITAAQVQAYFDKVEKQFASFLTSKDLLVAAIEEKGGTIYYQTDPAFVAKYGPSIPIYADLDESILSIPTGACDDVNLKKGKIDSCGGALSVSGTNVTVSLNESSSPYFSPNSGFSGLNTTSGTISSVKISGASSVSVAGSSISSLDLSGSKSSLTSFSAPFLSTEVNLVDKFKGFTNLSSIGCLDLSSAASLGGIFENTSISSSKAFGATVSHSYKNSNLSKQAIDKIFTNLGFAKPGATITVTGNPGSATADVSIAENKGWTVIV